MTIYLKLLGDKRAIIARLKAIDPKLVRQDEDGNDVLGSVYSHTVAMHYDPDLVLTQAVVDEDGNVTTPAIMGGPHVMLDFIGAKAGKSVEASEGVEIVNCGHLMRWAGA